MKIFCQLQAFVDFLLRRPQVEREMEEEFRLHLQSRANDLERQGLSRAEAERQARIEFGGYQRYKEECREALGTQLLGGLVADVRYGLRQLRRDRSFMVIAVVILGLGIGANVAVFSVVNTILLRPLPFREPARLVWIEGPPAEGGLSSMTYSGYAFKEYQERNRSLESVTAYMPFYGPSDYKLTGRGEPQPVSGVRVACNFFETLGVRPMLGRLFTPEECQKNGRPAALLSYFFWKRQLSGDPAIAGQAIELNNNPVTVAGVLPPTFDFGSVFAPGTKMDIFVPAIMDEIADWGNTLLFIGRMKPGTTVEGTQAEANLLFPHLDFNPKHREWDFDRYRAQVQSLKHHVSGKLRRSLIVLWSAVGLILLIVCVNLSNLELARAAARSKEFAMRAALGAGRRRMVRQLLTESAVLSMAGALLGLGFAFAITDYLAHQGSIALPLLSSLRVDGQALAWTLMIAAVSAVLFGLAPALKISDKNIQATLKESGHGTSEGRKHERVRATLVVSEVALACVLLIGAGLLLRSFLRVLDVDLGFEPDHAAAIKVDFDDRGANDAQRADRRGAIFEEMLRHVKSIPGIEAAGISDMLPLDRNRSWGLGAKGVEYSRKEFPEAFVYIVTPGYLAAMGIELREGRDFNWSDTATSGRVVILNEAAAKRLWPGQDALGRIAEIQMRDTRVIGVVSDVRETAVEESSGPEIYVPMTQAGPVGAELVVRTALPPKALATSVMRVLRSLNPGQPATEFRPIRQIVDHAISPRRFFVLLVSTFAALGLILALLGIYGVISYSVARRTQEIGIRMALGATQRHVLLGVLARTLRLALVGVAVGLTASFAAARLIASILFETQPTDPATFAAMAVVLLAVAFAAGYIPARRASRIDPIIALRAE
ncbi:MAG TPA: ABC transporter permease [Terriglobia bacterium]|nr:ABC transporter permease [Terriglobia bacterium]